MEYLFGIRAIPIYKLIFLIIIFPGCNASLSLVVNISDTFNGFMALPNLIAVALLSGQVVEMTKDYLNSSNTRKKGDCNLQSPFFIE